MYLQQIFIILIFHIILNFFLIFFKNKLAIFFNIFDYPDKDLKNHKNITPLIGGIFIFINLLFGYIVLLFLNVNFFPSELSIKQQLSFYILSILLFFLGIYDDKKNLLPLNRLFFASIIIFFCITINDSLVINSISVSFIENRVFFNKISLVFTILCVLLFIHASNLFDGINLQSILYFKVIFLYLLIFSNFKVLSIIIIISLFFLVYMNYKNYLFLGDSGIYLLSSIASFILINEYNVFKTILYADEIFVLMMVPGVDMIRLVIFRVLKRKNPFKGDRNHLHHLLTKKLTIIQTNLLVISMVFLPIFFYKVLSINLVNIIFSFLLFYIVLISILIKIRS